MHWQGQLRLLFKSKFSQSFPIIREGTFKVLVNISTSPFVTLEMEKEGQVKHNVGYNVLHSVFASKHCICWQIYSFIWVIHQYNVFTPLILYMAEIVQW